MINVTETSRLDVQLEVGGVQEQVTIVSEAALLQTESSALGRVTDQTLVSSLPLVTRNYTQIVTLSPGVAANVTNATELERYWRDRDGLGATQTESLLGMYGWVARGSYAQYPELFEAACEAMHTLRPGYAPGGRSTFGLLARLVGYRRAEWLALRYRRSKRWWRRPLTSGRGAS